MMKLIHTNGNTPSFFIVDNNEVVVSTGRGSFRKELIDKLIPGGICFGSILKTPKREFVVTPENPVFNGMPMLLSEEFQVENPKWSNPLYSLPNYKAGENCERETPRSFLSQFDGTFVIGGVTYPDNSCTIAFATSGFGVIPKPFSPLFNFINGQFQFKYWNGNGLIIATRESGSDTIFRAYEQAL